MLEFKCVHCGDLLRISEKYAGKEGTCPKCKKRILAPAMGSNGDGSRDTVTPPLPSTSIKADYDQNSAQSVTPKKPRRLLHASIAIVLAIVLSFGPVFVWVNIGFPLLYSGMYDEIDSIGQTVVDTVDIVDFRPSPYVTSNALEILFGLAQEDTLLDRDEIELLSQAADFLHLTGVPTSRIRGPIGILILVFPVLGTASGIIYLRLQSKSRRTRICWTAGILGAAIILFGATIIPPAVNAKAVYNSRKSEILAGQDLESFKIKLIDGLSSIGTKIREEDSD